MSRRIILVRHTLPAIAAGVCYGRTDLSLAASAPTDIANCLRRVPVATQVYSSPALRCRILAEALGARDAQAVQQDARLRELDFGAWEGRPWEQIAREELDRWAADLLHHPPGGGESVQALWQRVASFRTQLDAVAAGTVVIVGHSGSLRALRAQLLGQPPASMLAANIELGGVLEVTAAGGAPEAPR